MFSQQLGLLSFSLAAALLTMESLGQATTSATGDYSKEPLCSTGKREGESFNITIHNPTNDLISIFWVDNKCEAQFYYNIPPSNISKQPTWANYAWIAADNATGRIKDRFKPFNSNGNDWSISPSVPATAPKSGELNVTAQPAPAKGPRMLQNSTNTPADAISAVSSTPQSSSTSSSSVVIGAVVGSIVVLAAIAGFSFFIIRQRSSGNNTFRNSNPFLTGSRSGSPDSAKYGLDSPMTPRSPPKLEPLTVNIPTSMSSRDLLSDGTMSSLSSSEGGLVISRNTQGFFDPSYRPRIRTSSSRLSSAVLDKIIQDQLPSNAKRASDDGSFVVGKYFTIHHEYHGMVDDELTVFVKDQVQINALFDDGWCLVTHASEGIRGMIPQVCMMKSLPPCPTL